MALPHIAVLVGSLRKDSTNLRLAKGLLQLAVKEFDGNILWIDDLPLFNEDLEKDFPAAVTRIKNEIEKADAILFATPEYNRSITGVMKNAIDWASRPYGKNSFAGKPAAIMGISPGTIGTACAQQHLRAILGHIDMVILGQPEIMFQSKEGLMDENGTIKDESAKKLLTEFARKFAKFIYSMNKNESKS